MKSFSCLPAYPKPQLEIKNEMMCARTGERGREMAKKPFKARHQLVFYLYLKGTEMTNFCPHHLKRDGC